MVPLTRIIACPFLGTGLPEGAAGPFMGPTCPPAPRCFGVNKKIEERARLERASPDGILHWKTGPSIFFVSIAYCAGFPSRTPFAYLTAPPARSGRNLRPRMLLSDLDQPIEHIVPFVS